MLKALFLIPFVFVYITAARAQNAVHFDENTPIPQITNLDQIARQLHLSVFKNRRFSRKLKIAILDNGFGGYRGEVGKGLPVDTSYDPGAASSADRVKFASVHGTLLAKVFASLIQKSGVQADYELHLFNTFGYTKFEYAVNKVIQDRYDLVLYAQTWDTGGNVDTHGFINVLVTRATQAGIVWINAAGEYGGEMRVDPIQSITEDGDQWVAFKNKKGQLRNGVTIICRAPQSCPLHLEAVWNDIDDNPDTGTNKDLDLYLYDTKNKLMAVAENRQSLTASDKDPNVSIIPRETIDMVLPPGKYTAKLKFYSHNFSADKDVLRTIASGPGIQIENATFDDTLFPPAENPTVITVGASDDSATSRSKKLGRPDVYFVSEVGLKNSKDAYSTSVASAIAAAVATLDIGTGTPATREAVLAELKKISEKEKVAVAKTPATPVTPDTRCYQAAELPYLYRAADQLLAVGGKPIVYHGRLLIAVTPEYAKRNGLIRPDPDMWWFMTPRGIHAFSGNDIRAGLPADYYLIGYTNIPLCRL